jgi:hypothetical protein
MNRVREHRAPQTAAGASSEPEFRGTEAELISTNLSNDQEAKLRDAFGLED